MDRFTAEELDEFRAAFDHFDKDHSGAIDINELGIALDDLGVEVSTQELEALVRKVDRSGTGELDFGEFVDLIARSQSHEALNGGGDGNSSASSDGVGGENDAAAGFDSSGGDGAVVPQTAATNEQRAAEWDVAMLAEKLERLRSIRDELMDNVSRASGLSEKGVAIDDAADALVLEGFAVPDELRTGGSIGGNRAQDDDDDDITGDKAPEAGGTDDGGGVALLQLIDGLCALVNARLSGIVEYVEVFANIGDEAAAEGDEAGDAAFAASLQGGRLTAINATIVERELQELERFQFDEVADPALKQGVDAFKHKAKQFPFFMFPIESVCERIRAVDDQYAEYEALISGREFITKPRCPAGAKCLEQDNLRHRQQMTHPCYSSVIPCPHRHRPMHMKCYSHEPDDVPGQTLQEARVRELQTALGILDVSGIEMGDPGAECIAHVLNRDRALHHRDVSALRYRELRCSGNHISPTGGIPLLEACVALTVLDLSGNGLGYKGALLVNSGVGSALEALLRRAENLVSLNLARNGLGDRDARFICNGLRNNTTLRCLDLRKNELGPGFGADMAAALSDNRELKELYVGWNRLEASGSGALLEELRNDNTREVVDVSWTGVNDDGARCIGELIAGSSALRALNVSHNSIGRAGCAHVAKGLVANKSLVLLDLSFNPLGERAASELVREMRDNFTLETLDLRCVKAEDQTAREIRETMKIREPKMCRSAILFSTSVAATQQQQQQQHQHQRR